MSDNKPPVNFFRVYLEATILFVVDAMVFNQGFLAVFVLMIFGLGLLPVTLIKHRFTKSEMPLLKRYLIYTVASVLVLVCNYANNQLAEYRGVRLVERVERYISDRGKCPPALDALVPQYIDSVPAAKWTVWGEFRYRCFNERAWLEYTVTPPFGRNTYDFQKKIWHGGD